ncbi:MAG: secretin N-terminal domain-containing protein [Vicinamibacterales bacterium]
MTRRLTTLGIIFAMAVLTAACAAGRAFNAGEEAARTGDVDQAVAHFRAAYEQDPDNAEYQIALQRAMLAASRTYLERARALEEQDQLEAARNAYRRASDYDPTNRAAADKAAALDRTIRERIEAARAPSAFQQMQQQAQAASAQPLLNPASREPLDLSFPNADLRQVLAFIASFAGINVTYDRDVTDRFVSVQLSSVTLEDALKHLMTMSQLSYKVLSERSIFVFPDTPAKHIQYDEQVIRTFYLSHGDPAELVTLLGAVIRLPGIAVQPIIQANTASNTIVVRGTRQMVDIIARVIEQNDKPRAEIVIDVQIMEVNRSRAQQYGLNLSEYALGGLFSPEFEPDADSTSPSRLLSPPPINFDSFSGVTSSDFYTAVPTAVVRFLETDTDTKLIAKPQLRGAEGSRLVLNLGDDIPVVSTSYTPLASGGAGVNPLNSYTYRPVGVNIDLTPRVTLDGDIILDLILDNSSLGPPISVAGVEVPSFGKRTLTTRLRLRDGESNLLAGLLREDERMVLTGFPGIMNLPVLRRLFSANKADITQTDIVMILTPHIIRGNEIGPQDLMPIAIGSQQNLSLGDAPSIFGAPPPVAIPEVPPAPTGGAATPGATAAPGAASGIVIAPDTAANIGAPASGVPTRVPPPPAPQASSPAALVGAAILSAVPPDAAVRVGGGPYTVPIVINNAERISTLAVSLTFDPAVVRVRAVQEGSFMRVGGVDAAFTQQASPGRIDVSMTRSSDATGATGSGVVAAVLFEPVAPGGTPITISGVATSPNGTQIGLSFQPTQITVLP